MSALPNANAATSSPAASTTPTPTTPAAQTGATGTTTTESTPGTDTFDAAQFAADFGLPATEFTEVKDEAAALAKLRDLTDRALTAGIGFSDEFVDEEPAPTPAAPASTAAKVAEAVAKTGEATPPGFAELQKEVADLKAALSKQATDNEVSLKVQLNKRLAAVVDSWASPKYGVSGSRTYKQTKAFNDFTAQLKELVPGLVKTSQPIPVIETAALRLWSYDDPDGFDASRKGKKGGTAAAAVAPLGTPGQQNSKGTAGADAPGNIHEALYSGGRFVKSRT